MFKKMTIAALILGMALTACKKEIYYTVTFDPNGGQLHEGAVITVAEGDKVPYPWNPIAPDGYWFTRWYMESEQINEWNFAADVVTGDMTLYAGWERVYTFTFHAGGGTFHNNDGSETWTMDYLTEGRTLYVPANVLKPGYVLVGWYRDAALTDKWDFDTDVVTGDGELYAKWEAGIETLTRDNYPQVDGATSTRALNVMVACKLLGLPYDWDRVPETEEWCVVPEGERIYTTGSFFGGRVQTSQTHGAMLRLINGLADIILRSTTASPDEKEAARAAGVTLVETPIALDAFVFLKNGANPVQSLTIDQIRKIYTKQITDWSAVGGDKAAIKAFTRPRNSGSEEALRELVMDGLEPAEFPEEQQVHSMQGLLWEMGREQYGIGYIFKNYKEMIVRRYDLTFAIDGVLPTPATMKDRTYPLTTEVYAIIRSDLDRNSMAYKLYEWLQSESAKIVLEECGFSTLE